MKYILKSSDGTKLILSKNERDGVIKALSSGEKAVLIQDTLLSLAIAPTVMPFERWIALENERLATTKRRICKLCLCIMDAVTGCSCWENKGVGEAKNAFLLPKEVRLELMNKVHLKSMPEASELDIETEKVLMSREGRPVEYAETSGALGYKDPESGETLYS